MKKTLNIILVILLLASTLYPSNASADRIVSPLRYEANANAVANPGGSSSSSSGTGTGQGTSNPNGGGGGGGSGQGGGVSCSNSAIGDGATATQACAEANAQAIIQMGSIIELSPYLIESSQGRKRSTYVPDLEQYLKSEFAYEYKHASFKENRFFAQENKRDSIFNQDAYYKDEYIEALNWLYKNNLLHNIEEPNIHQEGTDPNADYSSYFSDSSSGGQDEYSVELELEEGEYTFDYQFYGIEDSYVIESEDGTVISASDGQVSGSASIPLSIPSKGGGGTDSVDGEEALVDETGEVEEELNGDTVVDTPRAGPKKKEKIKITINPGQGQAGTVWDFQIKSGGEQDLPPDKGEYDVLINERQNKDTYLYPYNEKESIDAVIPKKDFILNLMKVLDGVEESRGLLVETKYEYLTNKGEYKKGAESQVDLIRSHFKNQLGNLSIDIGINDLRIDWNNYAMHKYYVNPNVYELYFKKAYNSQMIYKNEFNDPTITDLFREDFEMETKEGHDRAKWDNSLPDVRMNTSKSINNDGEFKVKSGTKVFGESWVDLTKQKSNNRVVGKFTFSDFDYFIDSNISYLDAMSMIYKGINAYADDKLTQKEVDTIVSMYSVSYGTLADEEKKAMNYLIAKGIIDGNDSAKWTSTEPIITQDAMIAIYRVANKNARLTFKTVFGNVDEAMLQYGFGQSKLSVYGYEDSLPEAELYSEEYDYYYIPAEVLKGVEDKYILGTAPDKPLDPNQYEKEKKTLTQKERLKLGSPDVNAIKGETIIYKIKGNYPLERLGLYIPYDKKNQTPRWIEMTVGGGLHYLNQEVMERGNIESRFLNLSRNRYTVKELKEDKGEPSTATLNGTDVTNPDEEDADGDRGDEGEEVKGTNTEQERDKEKETDVVDPDNLFSGTFRPNKYSNDGINENLISIYMGLNESAIHNTLFDGRFLYLNGELNPQIISASEQGSTNNYIKNIKEVSKDPETGKVVLEFVLPRTGNRSVNELTSTIKRRLTLDGEYEAVDGDIAAYTSSTNGATMISQKELHTFGIEVTPQEPDILYHPQTETYAYINAESDYALISNSMIDFPKNSTMIDITADDIYYNIDIVMSLLNSDDFLKFTSEGKYEIVSKMKNLHLADVYNPMTGEVVDHTYTAQVKGKRKDLDTEPKFFGNYINLTAISGTANTFLVAHDKNENLKKSFIYGFEPYYYKSEFTGVANAQLIYNELEYEPANIIQLENILINNAILRDEFHIPNQEAFVYTDNALKVTVPHKQLTNEELAEVYMGFVKSIVSNMREDDLKEYAKNMNDSRSQIKIKDYSFDLLLNESAFTHESDVRVKKMVSNARKGIDKEAFWALYFLDRFTVRLYNEEGGIDANLLNQFNSNLVKEYNKNYTPLKFKVESVQDLDLLDSIVSGDSDIMNLRLFSFQPLLEFEEGGYITSSNQIYVHKNDSFYLKTEDFTVDSSGLIAGSSNDNLRRNTVSNYLEGTFRLNKYSAIEGTYVDDLNSSQIGSLNYQKNITGSRYYIKNSRVYAYPTERYQSLPDAHKPLELYPVGTKFNMNGEEFVIINPSVAYSGGGNEFNNIMVKIAKTKLKSPPEGLVGENEYEKMFNYYKDTDNYIESIHSLGNFKEAVHSYTEGMQYTISAFEIDKGVNQFSLREGVIFKPPVNTFVSSYTIITDMNNGLSQSKLVPLYYRSFHTMEYLDNSGSVAPVGYGLTSAGGINVQANNYSVLKQANFSRTLMVGTTSKPAIYESFLIDYGMLSLDPDNNAKLSKRSTNILKSSPVLNDLVNTLVRNLDISRADANIKIVGDLVNGDNLKLPSYGTSGNVMTLVKTPDKEVNGYSEFITKDPNLGLISPNEASYGNILVLKLYGALDGIKVKANLESNSLYHYIGNKQLNLASVDDIKRLKNQLNVTDVLGEPILTEGLEGTKLSQKELRFEDNSVTLAEVPEAKRDDGYKYFVEMYLDSNLLVAKNSNGVYELIGYSDESLINTKSWTSRQSRFEGVGAKLLTILPHVNSISGYELGFDTSKFSIDWFLKMFTREFWNHILDNGVYYLEQFVSVLGIYYLYLVMVVAFMVKSAPRVLSRWVFDPLSLITFGMHNGDNLDIKRLVQDVFIAIICLVLIYSGMIRILISKSEDIIQLIYDYIIVPLLF